MFENVLPAGLGTYGGEDNKTADGISGSTVYFVNYQQIDDTTRTIILGNIQKHLTLDGKQEAPRPYRNNDLIVCEINERLRNNVYKLSIDEDKQKYELEKIGYIETQESGDGDVFNKLHSDVVYLNIDTSKTISDCAIITNRSFDILGSDDVSTYLYDSPIVTSTQPNILNNDERNGFRKLFGLALTPTITELQGTSNRYDFYLKIYIKNTKSLLGEGQVSVRKDYSNFNENNQYSTTNVFCNEPYTSNNDKTYNNKINFEKIIEIQLRVNERSGIGGNSEHGSKTAKFLSDMACDKLHLSLNNYSSAFFDSNRMLGVYNTVNDDVPYVYGFDYINNDYIANCVKYNQNEYFLAPRLTNKIFDTAYGDASIVTDIWVPDAQHLNFKTSSAKYDSSMSSAIQYSKIQVDNTENKCMVNFRSGESAYFSGLIGSTSLYKFNDTSVGSLANNSYDEYVIAQRSLNGNDNVGNVSVGANDRAQNVAKFVADEIKNFIFNDSNTFELIVVNKETGLVSSKKISNPLHNTTTSNGNGRRKRNI